MAAPAALTRVSINDALTRYEQFLDRRLVRGEMSPRTIQAYTRDLAEFAGLVGGERVLDDISPEDVEVALTQLAKAPDRRFTKGLKVADDGTEPPGRGPHALARWFAAVRGMFRWARDNGFVQVDPTDRLSPPRTPKRARGARLGLQEQDAHTLRAAPSVEPAEPRSKPRSRLTLRDEALLRLFTESGPRVSEVCGANRSDIRIHEETGTPVLRVTGKGRKERDIPLSDATVAAIERYQRDGRAAATAPEKVDARTLARIRDADAALFTTVRGWRIQDRDVQRMVRKYSLKALPRTVTPHGLRHTALTILAREGTDIATVAQIAGHSNLATTSIYMDESMAAAARAIERSPMAR